MNDVTIVISTFGDEERWGRIAEPAINSARTQSVQCDWLYSHSNDGCLATARNEGAMLSDAKYLIFLDADDMLHPNYVEAMLADDDFSTLRQPSTQGFYEDGEWDDEPVLIAKRDLSQSNYLVIGTMCEREAFLRVGGFDPHFPVLEDWDLWCRMVIDGAKISSRPEAIYQVGVHPDSRNQNVKLHGRYYNQIRNKYGNQLRKCVDYHPLEVG